MEELCPLVRQCTKQELDLFAPKGRYVAGRYFQSLTITPEVITLLDEKISVLSKAERVWLKAVRAKCLYLFILFLANFLAKIFQSVGKMLHTAVSFLSGYLDKS